MHLKKALTKDTIKLELAGTTKDEIITEMVDHLVTTGKLKHRKAALKAVFEREKKMSTGMQNGIAIPHGKTDTVDTLVVAIGLRKTGIDFESLDGQPAKIFIMTISPEKRTGPHIQFLAEISRLLQNEKARNQVIDAKNEGEVIAALAG